MVNLWSPLLVLVLIAAIIAGRYAWTKEVRTWKRQLLDYLRERHIEVSETGLTVCVPEMPEEECEDRLERCARP